MVMAQTQRTVSKIEAKRSRTIDDQLWPTIVALVVLGGFMIATVLAYLQFDDPRWWANAWTYLILIPVSLIGVLGWISWIDSARMRRSMQLAITLCAILHMLVFITALETNLFSKIWNELLVVTDKQSRRREPKVLPEYHPRQLERRNEPNELERPVETETPEAEIQPITRRQDEQRESPRRPQQVPVPQREPTPRPGHDAAERIPRGASAERSAVAPEPQHHAEPGAAVDASDRAGGHGDPLATIRPASPGHGGEAAGQRYA